MTEQRLRELMTGRVADLEPIDLGESAWQAARRTRQRRATFATGAVVAVVVVVVALLARPGGQTGSVPPVANTPGPTLGQVHAERGGTYARAEVWWAPSVEDEPRLPEHPGTPLPAMVDLSGSGPAVQGIGRAVAVYEVDTDDGLDRLVVVGADGTSYRLDASRLVGFSDSGGNRLSPLSEESLSPDGRHLFLRQPGKLELYDFTDDTWTTVPVTRGDPEFSSWFTDLSIAVSGGYDGSAGGAFYNVDGSLREKLDAEDRARPNRFLASGDQLYGPGAFLSNAIRSDVDYAFAHSIYLGSPVERGGETFTGVDAVATRRDGHLAVLVDPGGAAGRWKGCCPVVGWLDGATVLFESRHEEARVLAWKVGSGDLGRVSDIRGWEPGIESFVSTYAETGGDPAFPDGS